MEKSELVVVAAPSPINPLKRLRGSLSVIHSMPGAQCFFLFKDVEKKNGAKEP